MEIAAGLWIVCGIIGAFVAGVPGFIWGITLGPVGVILLFVMGRGRECPACKSRVDEDATICKHCRTELPPRPFVPL